MSKRSFKTQASSSRAASGTFGLGATSGFSTAPTSTSSLSYLAELPDTSGISNPNIVVAFKNLTKKDPTTKAKALEELKLAVEKAEEVEEAFLSAWASLYPRTSIDNARRVRQLAHMLQGHVAAVAGKRVAKFLPQVVPVWLAGQYDNDRIVAKAAQDALQQVFLTAEKFHALRKIYQRSILEFISNVIEDEDAHTLSDERIFSTEEAAQKYTRVAASSMGLLRSMLSELPDEERQGSASEYSRLFQSRKLWDLALDEDPPIRRTLHRLLKAYLLRTKQPSPTTLHVLSAVYIYKGLGSNQAGSALDYLDSILTLTQDHHTVWTDHYCGKKPPLSRLMHFLQKGSQGAGTQYWRSVAQLFDIVPKSVLLGNRQQTQDTLQAFLEGIKGRHESRSNAGAAFSAYLHCASLMCQSLEPSDRAAILADLIFPLLDRYVASIPKDHTLQMPSEFASSLLPKIVSIVGIPNLVEDALPRWADQLVKDIGKSLPELSKDYKQSQQDLTERGTRLALLISSTLSSSETLRKTGLECSSIIIESCLLTCKARNGKPYSAAQIIVIFVKAPGLATHESDIWESQDDFATNDIQKLILSPSSEALIELMETSFARQPFQLALSRSIKKLLEDTSLTFVLRAKTLRKLLAISSPKGDLEQLKPLLRHFFKRMLSETLRGSDSESPAAAEPKDVAEFLGSLSLDAQQSEDVLELLTEALSISNDAERLEHALQTLQQVLRVVPSLFQSGLYVDRVHQLLSKVLLLTEASDERILSLANAVNETLNLLHVTDEPSSEPTLGSVHVVHMNLGTASIDSVSVETLLQHAKKLLSSNRSSRQSLMPDLEIWSRTLKPFLVSAFPQSVVITHPLGGAAYFAESEEKSIDLTGTPRDAQGLAVPLRMAMFLAGLLEVPEESFTGSNPLAGLPPDTQQKIFINLTLTTQLANENLSLLGSNKIFLHNSEAVIDDIVELVSKVNSITWAWQLSGAWWDYRERLSPTLFLQEALFQMLAESAGYSFSALAVARNYATIMSQMIEIHGWKQDMTVELEERLRELRRSKEVIQTVAFITAHKIPLETSALANKFCNELVAEISSSSATEDPSDILRHLVLLNAFLQNRDSMVGLVAKQRVVFLVRKIASWLKEGNLPQAVQAEFCKVTTMLLPLMGDMYGGHWEDLISFITSYWNSLESLDDTTEGSSLPLLHSTLRLHFALRQLADDDNSNDDLQEELNQAEQSISLGLLNILALPRQRPDDIHQPLSIVNQLLQRHVRNMSKIWVKEVDDIYPIILTPSRALQEAAYEILHSYIPMHQEQVIFDATLEKKVARLPDELLSLLLEPQSTRDLDDTSFDTDVPLGLRGYMLSWLLVFDHFPNVPFPVRDQYIAHLKEGTYIENLLDFAFEFLGHAKGKPFDVSKFHGDIARPFTLAVDGMKSFAIVPLGIPPLQEAQWLLCRLYYLCLYHLPSVAKSWWLNCKSRQMTMSVESWTAKYISPMIISAALAEVSDWSKAQTTEGDEQPLTIGVSNQSGTVTASYPVDDSNCAISITLPSTFPLHQATVASIHRIAVDERRWQSWLRTTQGVIAFRNNNIVEGLMVWRKNVIGQLKGQTECAICYAIVAEDGKLPSKKCRTCKNSFHGSCLFKWFKTSGGATCPLCRSAFNYG